MKAKFFNMVLWIFSINLDIHAYPNSTFPTERIKWIKGLNGSTFSLVGENTANDEKITLRGGKGCYCNLLINEINTDSPKPPPSLFIELRLIFTADMKHRVDPTKRLDNWYIMIVRANPQSVVFYVDLNAAQLTSLDDDTKVFVIGDPGLPELSTTGINLRHPAIHSIFRNPDQARLLPDGNDSPYAILLLYTPSRKRDLRPFDLQYNWHEGTYRATNVRAEDLMKIRDLITDMVVFGRKAPASSCGIFDNLWPDDFVQEPGRTYILRDYDTVLPDYSLNRCSSTNLGFQIQSFQYDTPSPGRMNPCEGTSFFVEDIIDQLAPLNIANKNSVTGCSADIPGIPPGRYSAIDERALNVHRDFTTPKACESCVTGPATESFEAMEIAVNNGEIQDLGGDPISVIVKSTEDFKPDMVTLATPYLPKDGELIKMSHIQQWLRVHETPDESTPIKFQCSVCMAQYGDKIADVKLREKITTTTGYFSQDMYKNARRIRSHAKTVTHIDAVNLAYKLANAASDTERKRLVAENKEKYDQALLPTVQMVRTVYAEALCETPFMYHPVIVNMEESNNVFLGFHHYHSEAAKEMTLTISRTMNRTLLQHLVKLDMPYSLIVDASTSRRNIPYLIVYFQLTEDGYPITYFYQNIPLLAGETARKTFDAFWAQVIDNDLYIPGFADYVKRRLTFFVSDNAAVMIGKNLSFLKLLEETLGRPIPNIGCMAHKLSLALKAALHDKSDPRLAYINTFESNLNRLYIFYMSRGSKRFKHLVETAEVYDIGVKRFRKNIEVRWAAGEYNCVSAILGNLEIVLPDLLGIQSDDSFTPAAKEEAEELYNSYTDLTETMVLHEFKDFLQINKILSERLQERSGLLLDHYIAIKQSILNYENLKDQPGPSLQGFIYSCACIGVCLTGECSLPEIEECKPPRLLFCNKDTAMSRTYHGTFKLSESRLVIYSELLKAIKKYFDMDLISGMIIFDQRQWWPDFDTDSKKDHFTFLCGFFKLDDDFCNRVSSQYFSLVQQLMSTPLYAENTKNFPSLFWPMVLKNEGNFLMISDELRTFLNILLVLGSSSSEAERGFSVMARLDSNARSGLSSQMLDALMRIKLNGMKPPGEIDAYLYAEEFVKTHHRVDDPRGGKERTTKDKIYQKHASRLF